MTSMKEIEELYNQLKTKGYYNVGLDKDNLTIYFDETHCLRLYPDKYYCAWGLDCIGRRINPDLVYTFDGVDTLTINTPSDEISFNLKGCEP